MQDLNLCGRTYVLQNSLKKYGQFLFIEMEKFPPDGAENIFCLQFHTQFLVMPTTKWTGVLHWHMDFLYEWKQRPGKGNPNHFWTKQLRKHFHSKSVLCSMSCFIAIMNYDCQTCFCSHQKAFDFQKQFWVTLCVVLNSQSFYLFCWRQKVSFCANINGSLNNTMQIVDSLLFAVFIFSRTLTFVLFICELQKKIVFVWCQKRHRLSSCGKVCLSVFLSADFHVGNSQYCCTS